MITVDIETAANGKASAYWDQKGFSAPGNYKDEAKIKAAIEEKRMESRGKSGLYPWTARVTCIVCFDGEWHTFYGEEEAVILRDFGTYLSTKGNAVLTGKNFLTFDNPMLVGRYIAHDLGVPAILRPTDQPRDVDHAFGFSSQSIRGSLKDYAWLMGIQGKLAHGSQAQTMFDEAAFDPEKWKDLVSYCQQDVAITHEFLTRYLKPFVPEIEEPIAMEDMPF